MPTWPSRTSTSSSASATTCTRRPTAARSAPTRRRPTARRRRSPSTAPSTRIYHTDEHLLEVRRQFPLVAIWDDHEVEDNYAGDMPGGAAENRRVPFEQRRGNGYRAFFEHMPRRLRRDFRTYGRIPLGNAELFLLDTRQFRDDQPCSPTDARPRRRAPRRSPTTRSARCSAMPRSVAEGRAERLAGALEARRQPGDDHVARRRAAQPAQHRLVGRLRRRPARAGRGAAAGRRVRDRRHPHVLHRPCDGQRPRPRTGPACARSSSSPAP